MAFQEAGASRAAAAPRVNSDSTSRTSWSRQLPLSGLWYPMARCAGERLAKFAAGSNAVPSCHSLNELM